MLTSVGMSMSGLVLTLMHHQVNEVNLDLPDNIISRLSNEINPLENSSAFAIDIFQRALEFLENLLPNHSSQ